MATNNTSTKSGPNPNTTAPFPNGPNGGPSKDSILNDLRRQLDDSDISSNAGSNSSSRRRRRRRKNNNNGENGNGNSNFGNNSFNKSALGQPLQNTSAPVLPRLAETKPVRLQLGLNLDVELELKARIQGDPISITKTLPSTSTSSPTAPTTSDTTPLREPPPRPTPSPNAPEIHFNHTKSFNPFSHTTTIDLPTSSTTSISSLPFNLFTSDFFSRNCSLSSSSSADSSTTKGQKLQVLEDCYITLGTLRFRQHWLQREVSQSLSAAVLMCVLGIGVLIGFLAGWVAAGGGRCRFVAVE